MTGNETTSRFFNRRAGGMLWRNTVVSTSVFCVGLGVLWALVEWGGVDATIATAITFILNTTVHYVFGRIWIFAGSDRNLASGYAFFFLNAGIGLFLTVSLFWLLVTFTPINYLVARIVVSVFAGLAMFGLNAVFNFRQL